MRLLVVIPALALAVAACTTQPTPVAASPATPWRPATGTPNIECRWDQHAEPRPGPELEAACKADPACGCATLGHALLMASNGAVEARALEVLDGACHRGVLLSCDEAAMVEELCVRGTARPSPACGVLARQGRLGSAEMQR
ncbi:MAG TPA: hypothetical protein VGL81_29765 [Polyangiaceae bacterium]|jgi:hypothetical protein